MSSFVEIEVQYKTFRAQLDRGELTQAEFMEKASGLMCQDDTGRWWTVHPESGMWHHRWKEQWRPGVPPGHTPAVVKRVVIPVPELAPEGRPWETETAPLRESRQRVRRALPRWVIPALAALVLVAAVVALVFFVVLPALEGEPEPTGDQLPSEIPLAMATFTAVPAGSASPEPISSPDMTAAGPEPSPTASPLPEGPDAPKHRPQWPVVLTDDFSDAASGWSRGMGAGVVVDYRDGGLYIELQGGGKSGWSRYEPVSFSNVWFEVTVQGFGPNQEGAISMAGMAVDVTEDYFGIVFRIDSTGRYSIGRTLPLDSPPLVNWTFSEHIHTDGKANRLAVMVENDRYAFFVNGWLLHSSAEIRGEFYSGGLLALWGASGQGFSAPITFDDAIVLSGPDLASDEVIPLVTETPSPVATIDSSDLISPTVEVAASPVPTTSLEPLSFEMSYDTWYPGSGDSWIARFRIQALGGDGRYSYSVASTTDETGVLDLEWPCGSPLTADIVVASGDGQQLSKSVWIAAVACE